MLRHRGPDEFGIYRDAWVGMASARLSIIDLSGGQQPICNEDGSLWIVYNGEVFNYLELRRQLEARGHQFSTTTDTEVILHLYEEYGPDCLRYLNGQFAIALWDTTLRRLFLARDRMGIRPLYYQVFDNRLLFGSEIKSILAYPGNSAVISRAALPQVFTFWSTPAAQSVFEGICQVPPGQYLLCQDGKIETRAYWSLDFKTEPVPHEEDTYLEAFESLLADATRIRLRADVPVGAYLSGGLDSSVTSALIRRDASAHLDTFSISFSDSNFNESAHQRRMAEFLGTDHHEVFCTQQDIGEVFPEVIWHTETPILRTAPAPMFLLSKLVHQHNYKVVLTGEGADELLAGYDIFKEMKLRRFWAEDPESTKRPLLFKKLYPDIPRTRGSEGFLAGFYRRDLLNTASPYYSHRIRWYNTARSWRFLAGQSGALPAAQPEELDALIAAVPVPEEHAQWSPLAQAQFLEITTFLSPYLLSSQGDRMAMANSVEGRYPFLDYRVVEFCNRLPDHLKLDVLHEKYLLRKLGRKLVPPEIWRRTKRPYRAPIQRSFFSAGSRLPYVTELLSERSLRGSGYFIPEAVGRLVQKAQSESRLSEVEEMALVGILSTQLVDRLFVQRDGFCDPDISMPRLKVVDRLPQ